MVITPNYFSLNYYHGRTHSAMVGYLAECSNESPARRVAFNKFLISLGMKPLGTTVKLGAVLERNSVDLALLDLNTGAPVMLVETKVDDHEHGRWDNGVWEGQTTRYRKDYLKKNPDCQYAFLTVGLGEAYKSFESEGWVWWELDKYITALSSMTEGVELLPDYLNALKLEQAVRREASKGKFFQQGFRERAASVYFLAALRDRLLESPWFSEEARYVGNAMVYSASDTILELIPYDGKTPMVFAQINQNGMLNLKVGFGAWEKHPLGKKWTKKARFFEDVKRKLMQALGERLTKIYSTQKPGNTKTIASIDIGIEKASYSKHQGGQLPHPMRSRNMDQTIANIRSVLPVILLLQDEIARLSGD